MNSNIGAIVFGLNVRTKDSQPSICVRTFSLFTKNEGAGKMSFIFPLRVEWPGVKNRWFGGRKRPRQTSVIKSRSLARSDEVTIPHQAPREARLLCSQTSPSGSRIACLMCTNLDLLASLGLPQNSPATCLIVMLTRLARLVRAIM
jgi:hypothetical protein